jgi:hypothetical protein
VSGGPDDVVGDGEDHAAPSIRSHRRGSGLQHGREGRRQRSSQLADGGWSATYVAMSPPDASPTQEKNPAPRS